METIVYIPVAKCWYNRDNYLRPISGFDDIRSLVMDILNQGLITPLIVKPDGDRFEVITGVRRLMCLQILKWVMTPAKIFQPSDLEMVELQRLIDKYNGFDDKVTVTLQETECRGR